MAYYSRLLKASRAVQCGRDYVVHVVKRFVHSASPKFNHGNDLINEADQQCLLIQLVSLEEMISSKDGLHVHLDILGRMAFHVERTVLEKGASNKLKDFTEWEKYGYRQVVHADENYTTRRCAPTRAAH